MGDTLTPQEQAYFDNRGDVAETPQQEQVAPETPPEVPEPEAEADVSRETQEHEEKPKDGSWVPVGALHKERARLKETKAELEAIRSQREADNARWQLAQDRLNQMSQVLQQMNQPAAPPAPDFDSDPVGAARHGIEQTGVAVQQLNKKIEEIGQAQEQQRQMAHLTNLAIASETRFREKTPDFQDAVTHLLTGRINELKSLQYNSDQIRQVLEGERMQLMMRSAQSGTDWASTLYDLAKFRGYQPKTVPAEQKMQKLQDGQKAAAGISDVSGRQTVPLSVQSLAEMDDDEFYKVASNPKEWKKLMGG